MNKQTIYAKADSIAQDLFEINDWMYENPEIGHQEFGASDKLANLLTKHGFDVQKPYGDLETAFRAEYGNGDGPTIAILAEYDALPGIGNGCGHNVIGTGAVGGAIALKEAMKEIPGKLVLLGCPAEEGVVDNAGGKVLLVQKGAFKDIDAAIMFHPTSKNHRLGSTSNARYAMEIVFKGKTAHAAGDPYNGINALDAAIQTFNGFNALRQHVKEDVRIHGVITEGGKAPNIVPDRAVIRMYVRSKDAAYLDEVVEKVKNCAKAGALATGASVEMRKTANTYKNMVNNQVLNNLFKENLEALGEEVLPSAGHGAGSTDMSDVSQEVPGIHPYISISNEKLTGHSTDIADATISETGHKGILLGAKTLASVAYDLFTNPEYLKAAKEEFEEWKASK